MESIHTLFLLVYMDKTHIMWYNGKKEVATVWKDSDRILQIYTLINDETASFPAPCPDCGENAAHLYLHRHSENGRGGVWAWCSECHAFAHASDRIPEWWINCSGIEMKDLFSEPVRLDEMAHDIDEWVNFLQKLRRTKTEGETTVCGGCGSVMRPIDEEGSAGMKCDKCGLGWVTTRMAPPILRDETVYTVKISDCPDLDALRTLAKVFGCSYTEVKKRIGAGEMKIDGKAVAVKEIAERLGERGVTFEISPPFPYSYKK